MACSCSGVSFFRLRGQARREEDKKMHVLDDLSPSSTYSATASPARARVTAPPTVDARSKARFAHSAVWAGKPCRRRLLPSQENVLVTQSRIKEAVAFSSAADLMLVVF